MFIINIVILLLFVIGLLLSIKNSKFHMKDINKKEHKLYFLYPLADWILTNTRLNKIIERKVNVKKSIRALNITTKPELLQRLYWCNRTAQVIAVVVLFNLLSLLGQLVNDNSSVIYNGKYLQRPGYGEGSSEVELNVTMDQPEGTGAMPKGTQSQEISIEVEERSYTLEEMKGIFEKAFAYLKKAVLGNNESIDNIYKNLNFIKGIPSTNISVKWQPEDYNLIESDGTIHNAEVTSEGVLTKVTVDLTCQDKQARYCMSFRIMPKQYKEEEILQKELEEQVNTYAQKSAGEDYLELPDTLGKYHLSWEDKVSKNDATLFMLGIIAAVVCWLYSDKELEKQMKKRKNQMLFDYPEIINKFTLLINAGMTVKQAWSKVAADYYDKSTGKRSEKHYAYEEMLITVNELKLGVPESTAYEQYGRRIGLIPYIKFSSLISQNLKKGNKGFTELLMKEAIESFEERKEIVKRLGEEAGTKLLIPMMIMLVIVLLMIMIPAFWSFNI